MVAPWVRRCKHVRRSWVPTRCGGRHAALKGAVGPSWGMLQKHWQSTLVAKPEAVLRVLDTSPWCTSWDSTHRSLSFIQFNYGQYSVATARRGGETPKQRFRRQRAATRREGEEFLESCWHVDVLIFSPGVLGLPTLSRAFPASTEPLWPELHLSTAFRAQAGPVRTVPEQRQGYCPAHGWGASLRRSELVCCLSALL